jgi:hypothetical protein
MSKIIVIGSLNMDTTQSYQNKKLRKLENHRIYSACSITITNPQEVQEFLEDKNLEE